jgi:hypothetical protein
MPLAHGKGPGWTRPLVTGAEERLSGLNPVRNFFASLFGVRRRPAAAAISRRGLGPEDGPAGSGVPAPLVPPSPTLSGRAAKQLGSD